MNIIYFSHSYRPEDNYLVNYFGTLLREEGLTSSLDPPSTTVNAAKLERHLNSCDGMVAIITWRVGGISQHILFEINMCFRSRKPILIFIEDILDDYLVPLRILQMRFSRKSYQRSEREHRHVINTLKDYLGAPPSPKYQPSPLKRSCLIVGTHNFKKADEVIQIVEKLNYRPIIIDEANIMDKNKVNELTSTATVSLNFLDEQHPVSSYLLGMIDALLIPSIKFTDKRDYLYNPQIPIEYQPRFFSIDDDKGEELITEQFLVFEEDFIELDNQAEVEKYTKLLNDVSDQKGNYDTGTRNYIIVNMRDQFNVGIAGIVGPNANNNSVVVNEKADEFQKNIDLKSLADELSKLRQAMRGEASNVEHDIALSDIAKAEQAAKNNDAPKVMEYLKSAGKWALDVAIKIGVALAVEALKKSM